MKIAVYGSRSWEDLSLIEGALPSSFELLTLDQPGACALALEVAKDRGQVARVGEIRFTTFDRRAVMAALTPLFREADQIMVFVDDSEGSRHGLELARRSGKAVKVWGPQGELKEWELGEKPRLF